MNKVRKAVYTHIARSAWRSAADVVLTAAVLTVASLVLVAGMAIVIQIWR